MRDKSFFKWVCLFVFLSLFSVACDDGGSSDHHDMNMETGDDGEKKGGSEGSVNCPSECPNRCDTNGQCISEETTCPKTCQNGCDANGACLPDDVTCPETCQNGCDANGACLPDDVTCPETCLNGCDADGACLPDAETCPETCLNGCDADGACLPDDVTCPETCQNGCDADGACLPDDVTCPETCLNGCDADGACLPDDVTCPETCQNGCDADGACLPDNVTCPETCQNGCNADGSCKCPETCTHGCVDNGTCACPDTCQYGCDASGNCNAAPCPSACQNGCNADGTCKCPTNCQNGCNASNGTCACPGTCQYGCDASGNCNAVPCPSACQNGCNADGSCKCPSNCKSGCNASNGTCTCPTTCSNGCNADGSCKCPSNCKSGCNASNGTCTCPTACKNGCNADGTCKCPTNCQNGCNASNGTCTCPAACKNGCNANGSCKCPSNCKNGCNASNGTCTCPTACKNGCNADGSCKCPTNCQNGCNASNGTCTCPAACKNGCNANGSACACPSSCKTSCNPNGVCCKDNNCKGVCNDDGNCVTCDGGKAITQIRFVKPFTNSAGKTTNISIAGWDLKKLKDASESNASKRTSDTMTIWVKTSDGTQYQMNNASSKCKPEITLSCTGSAVKGSWNQSKGLLTIQSTTTAGSTTCTASLKNDKHIKDTLQTRSLNFNTLKDSKKIKIFAGQIQGNKTDPVLGDPSDNNAQKGVFDPQGFDFIDNDNFYFSRVCDNGKTTDGTPWRRSFCVHKNNKGDHSYNADPVLQMPGAGHSQNLSYESGSPGYLWFANFGTLVDDKFTHGYQKSRILTRFPLDQKGKYNKSPKQIPGTHYYYSQYKQNGKVYNQGIVNLEAAVDNQNNMIAIRGSIKSSTDSRNIWVYKLSNITDNLSASKTDYAVYIEKTLNSFKEPIADIDPDRKYTIEKSQLKDLSTVSHLNNFSKDVPGGQGITLANGFVFFVYENIENLGSNLYKSTLTTRVFTYAGTQIGSGFDLVFDSSTPNNIGSILNIGDGYKFNGYVEAEGIRYRNGKVYIFAKVRFNKKDGKLNNLRTAYIFEIDITQ